MTIISRIPFFHLTVSALLLLSHACSSRPVATPAVTVTSSLEATRTSTATLTATLRPVEATSTEFARQAEGTRQVLVDTQVALEQNANATATSRALDATATALAPLFPEEVTVSFRQKKVFSPLPMKRLRLEPVLWWSEPHGKKVFQQRRPGNDQYIRIRLP